MYIYISYAHLASVRLEHSACHVSLMTNYIYYIYINVLFKECHMETKINGLQVADMQRQLIDPCNGALAFAFALNI